MTLDFNLLEEQYTLPTLPGGSRLPFAVVRGEGCYVFDDNGNRYLDLYGGHAVNLLGYGHARWLEALNKQARELCFYSTVSTHPKRAEAAALLVENSYPSMEKVFFCNSGAEANESALKLARKATGKSEVISMHGGFHGRTLAALSVTGLPKLHASFPDNLTDRTHFVSLGDLAALKAVPVEQIAAVIVEPIQSVSGVHMASPEYYRELREYCSSTGIVLIFDEVQTGSGRTGKWYVGTHWGVEPDIVSTAKGVAGGFPAGAVIVNGAIAGTVKPADHASTFGGGPLAAACVAATYRTLIDERLVERVARLSAMVQEELRKLIGGGLVRDVRGLGYLLGVECEMPAGEVQAALLKEGILVGTSGQSETFRLLPPLTLQTVHWEEFLNALQKLSRNR